MKYAEYVTFGTSGLDRAAHLRADPVALRDLRDGESARCLLMWKGKICLAGPGEARDLLRVPLDHPACAAPLAEIFLGFDDATPLFARDISDWQPQELDLASLGAFLDASEQNHPDLAPDQSFAELRAVMTRLSPRDGELAATAKAVFGWHESHGFCARCGAASEIVMAGWQRECPICKTSHFPRTDPVVIMLITKGNSVLLGRSPGWPEGMYSLLAGFVEPGETIEAAVRREVMEEAGILVGAVSYLASQPWPFPASLMLGLRGEALKTEITLDANELDDAIWVTKEQLAGVFDGKHPTIRAPRKGAIAHFLLWNWLADRLE